MNTRRITSTVIIIVGLHASIALGTGSHSWNVSTGDWEIGTNWSPARQTGLYTDALNISNGGTSQFHATSAQGILALNVNNGIVDHTEGSLTISQGLSIGSSGWYAMSEGQYAQTSLQVNGNIRIGTSGTGGAFTQDGGACSAGTGMQLGYASWTAGEYDLLGGTLTVDAYLDSGVLGTGVFYMEAGDCYVNGDVRIGLYDGSDGTVAVAGGRLVVDGALYVGYGLETSGSAALGITTEAVIAVEKLSLGNRAILYVPAGDYPSINLQHVNQRPSLDILAEAEPVIANEVMIDLSAITFYFRTDDAVSKLEVAGAEPAGELSIDDFSAENFVIGELYVGGQSSPVELELVDAHDNKPGAAEAVYVKQLTIASGGTFTMTGQGTLPYSLYFLADGSPKKLYMGDATLDGCVNVDDLGVLASHYDETGPWTWAEGDFTGDGVVNVDDLGILSSNYDSGREGLLDQDDNPVLEDVNDDGVFDIYDVRLILERWRSRQQED